MTQNFNRSQSLSNRRMNLQMQQHNFTNHLLNALVHRKFNLNNGMQECCICMEKFVPGKSDITPLSHNQNHYFHTKCLEQWLTRSNQCPICRTVIKAEEEIKFREMLESKQ